MTDPLLSPKALVAVICALVALTLGGYFLFKRLRLQLGGAHHQAAVWGILAVFAAPLAALLGLAAKTESLLALAPAMILAGALQRLAPRLTPWPTQFLALLLALAGAGGVVLICGLRALGEGERTDLYICLACGVIVILMPLATLLTLSRPDDSSEPGTPA